jgi:hypothetical protein
MHKHLYYGDDKAPVGGIDPVIYEALGLSDEVLEQIQEQVRKKVAEASQLYGMVAA